MSAAAAIGPGSMDFRIGTDVDRALANVREKVDAARILLPTEARAPIVAKLDINAQPVLYLALSSESQFGRLRQIVDAQVKPRIARVPGVASVTVVGGRQREIQVSVDSRRLAQIGITMAIVVIGGLLASTFLTLIVIPVLYTLFDDLRTRLTRKA